MPTTFTVARQHLDRANWITAPRAVLEEGSVRVRIDAFALTSNNITYAAFGESMHYWDFYPSGEDQTGCIPVWGFGDIVESRCAEVPVGERYYGYFPMADEVILQPVRSTPTGFTEGAPGRRALAAVYNRYVRCAADPLYEAGREAEQALLRPLFITSFLIDDFLADNAFFGAGTVLLSSASSKTAYGTAFCLALRRRITESVRVVGLTSPSNLAFCRALKCYDEVVAYPEIDQLPRDVPTVYVDMSGSMPIRAAVHGRFGATLRYSCAVGGTHWEQLGSAKGLPGPRPVLFFAPAQIKKRYDDWGAEGFDRRVAAAWQAFMAPVTDCTAPWLEVVRSTGTEAVEATYRRLLAGSVPAREGHVLTV